MKIAKLEIKHLLFFGVFLFALFGFAQAANAATYYVAKAGSDSNVGTQTSPFQTIQKCVNTVSPGDTCFVKAGTYNERVTLTKSGNATQGYITLSTYPGETAYIDGTGLGAGVMFEIYEASWIKVIGFKIGNYTGAGIRVGMYSGYAGSHIEIRNNEVYNQRYAAGYNHNTILFNTWPWGDNGGSWTDIVIDGNYIHDVVTGVATAFNEAMTISGNVSRFRITNNTIGPNVTYLGIDTVGRGSEYPHNGIISGNSVSGVAGASAGATGIYVDGAKNIVIEDNDVRGNDGFGISISMEEVDFVTENVITRRNRVWNNAVRNISVGSREYTPTGKHPLASNIRAIHNTTVLTSSSTTVGNFGLYAGAGTVLKNNISYISGPALYHVMQSPLTASFSYSFDYNGYYGNSNKYWSYQNNIYTPFSQWQAIGQDGRGFIGDPVFVNLGGSDFHLQSGSSYIDAGSHLTTTAVGGSGQSVVVRDARYFTDGYAVMLGDMIKIGSNDPVRVTGVNYDTNIVLIDKSISWKNGDGVSYAHSGLRPDIGAYEYVPSTGLGLFSADLNSDSRVNSVDAAILMGAWGSTSKPKADINQDGIINSVDASLIMGQWTT